MTETTFNTLTVQLRFDARDVKIEHLVGTQFTGLSTYITYKSDSHPHKHCVHVVFGKYEQLPKTEIINGKIQLIEMF